ncbi:MAG: nucleotidyltransferase family protein [Candidatus Omnitrophica bacterium]|nr:nucleotidyltransferase family protein [Candidatus Omnitrophota bacterium]
MLNLDDQADFLRILASQDTDRARQFFVRSGFDPVGFKNFILEHELYFYADLLEHFHPRDYLPPDVIDELRSYRIYQWIKNEKLLREMENLSALLENHQKEAIFLKGPFLAKRFYPASSERVIHDMDLLVQKADVESLDRLLLEAGYQRTFWAPLGRKLASYFVHHFTYYRQGFGVEIHWCLAQHIALRIDDARLWQEKISYAFRNRRYFVLSPEYELVMQILSIFGDLQQGWFKFKSLLDAVMVLRSFSDSFDWDDFFRRRRKEKIFVVSVNILDLILDMTDSYDTFSGLADYLRNHDSVIRLKNRADKRSLFSRHPFGMKQKGWGHSLYESPTWVVLGWWALSLPFRLLVHHNDFENRCRSFFYSLQDLQKIPSGRGRRKNFIPSKEVPEDCGGQVESEKCSQ